MNKIPSVKALLYKASKIGLSGDIETAKQIYKQIANNYDCKEAYLQLGTLYFKLNNPDKAEKYLKKALNTDDPNTLDGANYYLGRIYMKQNNKELAKEYLSKSNLPLSIKILGLYEREDRNFQKAALLFEKGMKLRNAECTILLGDLFYYGYFGKPDINTACRYYQKSLEFQLRADAAQKNFRNL